MSDISTVVRWPMIETIAMGHSPDGLKGVTSTTHPLSDEARSILRHAQPFKPWPCFVRSDHNVPGEVVAEYGDWLWVTFDRADKQSSPATFRRNEVEVLTDEQKLARTFCYDNGCSPLNAEMLIKFAHEWNSYYCNAKREVPDEANL